MGYASPCVRRVAAILDLLSSNRGRSFTHAEISRALDLSHATTHMLLKSLEAEGYIFRLSNKKFIIGQVINAIGHAALQNRFPANDLNY
jgi:DNA-binding IclR family transcriptional regulator